MTDNISSIARSAKQFFVGTLFSRITGMVRDMAMAFSFGSAPEIAAFMVAYRLSNLFRRLLGEGNLQAGFVPHFEQLRAESPQRAAFFYRDLSFSLSLILIALILLLEGVLWVLLGLVGSAWGEIVELTMWMLPGLLFICLSSLNSSLLQCEKRYFLPAVAPVVFNFVWTGAALSVSFLPKMQAVRLLALAVTTAFAGQWLATAFEGRRVLSRMMTFREWLHPQLFSEELKKIIKPLSLGILGVGAVQFNSALDAIFARMADPEGPAFLWYAIRIEQLPLALFGIALSGALLPPLSRAIQRGDQTRYKELLQEALTKSAALMFFCTFGIFALGEVGINLLYGRGDFSPSDVEATAHCLWGYGLGLVPSVFVLLLAQGFYAQKSYRIPMIASLASVALNIGLNALFVFAFNWGAVSIALATSISSFLNLFLLVRREVLFTSSFGRACFKMTVGCGGAALLVFLLYFGLSLELVRSFPFQALQFLGLTAAYTGAAVPFVWRHLRP